MFGNEPDPFLLDLIGADLTKNKEGQNSKSRSFSFKPQIKTKPLNFAKDKM